MPTELERLEALNEGATGGPWAQQDHWPLSIVPESQKALACGGATDPKQDRERYAQEIAIIQFDQTPGEWRKDFPHRRLNRDLAKADAALIAAARNALPDLLAVAKVLERIRENARSWHGPEGDKGHERALAVIGTWCDEALAPLLREASE
jgi:hypothetical protein